MRNIFKALAFDTCAPRARVLTFSNVLAVILGFQRGHGPHLLQAKYCFWSQKPPFAVVASGGSAKTAPDPMPKRGQIVLMPQQGVADNDMTYNRTAEYGCGGDAKDAERSYSLPRNS